VDYMAPEIAKQFNNQGDKLDWFTCDTYSMGIVFLRLCGAGRLDIPGLNGSDREMTSQQIEDRLKKCLQKVRDAYKGVDLNKFIELLTLMLRNDPLRRPDMLDVYGACVKGKKLVFENLAKLDNVYSDKPEPQTMYDMAMLFSDISDRKNPNPLKTDKRTVEWFERAEAAGHVEAQFMLGWINQYGLFTQEKDKEKLKKKAKEYYTKAAAKGDEEAIEALANFDKPEVEFQVTPEAQQREGAEKGDVDDQFMMGWRYHYGLAVAENQDDAKKYYQMAVAQKDEDAEEELAKLIAGN